MQTPPLAKTRRGETPPPSPAPAAGGASPEVDEAALVKLPVVRELIIENERLLSEAAAFRRLRRFVVTHGPTRLLLDEQVARAALALAESGEWQRILDQSRALLLSQLLSTEEELAEVRDQNDQLQGYMALAKANLSPLPEGPDHDDEDGVRRRLSAQLSDKENMPARRATKRGAMDDEALSPTALKRTRLSADSSGRKTLPSPTEITRDRKTLLERDLAISPSRRKALHPRR